MCQPDQAVALRVRPVNSDPRDGEQAARWHGLGEEHPLAGQLVQPWARNVGVTVDAEIPAKVVPVHDQDIVALVCHIVVHVVAADCRHLFTCLALSTLSAAARRRVWRGVSGAAQLSAAHHCSGGWSARAGLGHIPPFTGCPCGHCPPPANPPGPGPPVIFPRQSQDDPDCRGRT